MRALYDLAEHCSFGETKDEQIRARLVIGIADPAVSQKLQLKTDLKLTQAIKTVRNAELVKSQNAHSQSHMRTTINSFDAVSQCWTTQQWKKEGSGPCRGHGGCQYMARQGQGQDCGNCRYRHEKCKEHFPAQHTKCRSCQRIGHCQKVSQKGECHQFYCQCRAGHR